MLFRSSRSSSNAVTDTVIILKPDFKSAEQSWHVVTQVDVLDAQHFKKSGS